MRAHHRSTGRGRGHIRAARVMVAIKAADLAMSFGGVLVLRGITLDIAEGEIHGLVGENGAGKST